MGYVDFKKIYKKYDNAKDYSVKDFNLEIQKEEFVVFVGPSGCGKSTTLRMLAGLEEITDGEILIEGSVVNDVHPKDRDIAMVFQNYALYPHMSVYDNIAFGLKIKKVPKEEIKKKVEHAANILGLEQYLKRKPKDLSGGQRQRVALGRAIVRNPKVFLMDEPLSNLDAKLRVSMRNEITKLHKELKATTVYVTHDQVEAMTMADKIVVLKDGIIQQIGTPMELYNTPINTFVAGFIGTPNMNLLNAKIKGSNLILENQKEIKISEGIEKKLTNYDEVIVGIRAEDFSIKRIILENNKDSIIKEKIVSLERMGNENNVFVKISSAPVVLKIQAKEMLEVGQELEFVIKLENAHFFDSKTNLRIN